MTTLTPHGECLLWTPELIWVNAVSDLLISFAFFAIAFVLAYIVYRRRDFQFSYIFWAFALFVSICGMTRLIEVLTIWIPAYVLEAATKGFLAFISVGIAAALLLMLPRVLTMPSRAELRLTNLVTTDMIADVLPSKGTVPVAELAPKAPEKAKDKQQDRFPVATDRDKAQLSRTAEALPPATVAATPQQ